MLALGQRLLGHPIAGVWVSTALACAAMWWALVAFFPRRWATLGALLAATHPLMLSWNHGYWGGAVAATGGALVVGGVARVFRRGSVGAGMGLGLGIFVLGISRPFEGAVLTVLSILLLRPPSPQPSPEGRGGGKARAIVTAMTMVALGAGWIGYYNWRVTHDALRMPYVVYEETYAITSPFVWVPWSGQVPHYRHEAMRKFYVHFWLELFQRQRTMPGFLRELGDKLWKLAAALFWSIGLIVPLLVLPGATRRDRRLRRALFVAGAFTLVVLGHLGFFPHYISPAVAVYLLILVQSLRHLHAWLRGRGGRWLVRGVVAAHVVAALVWMVTLDRSRGGFAHFRAGLVNELTATGGRHLVIVRPLPGFNPHNEYVFNAADIDAAPVVWARDMGAANAKLLEHFSARRAWLLEVDAESARLNEYPR
jgi:hypothetical protein